MTHLIRTVALGGSALTWVGLLLSVPAPAALSAAAVSDTPCSESVLVDSELLSPSRTRANPPLERMHVPRAREITAGAGVRVAVIDSGVQPQHDLGLVPVATTSLPGLAPMLLSGHGTVVAGLIAGRDGVAPRAEVVDVRVFDTAEPDVSRGEKDVTSQGIAAGIQQAVDLHRTMPFQVANIAMSVDRDDPALRRAIKDLLRLDVVVVAAAGNVSRVVETFEGTRDNDAAVYPADYPGVLAVSAVAPPGGSVIGSVVPNRDTDVAAPTLGAVSVNANGQRCEIDQVATSWAAAEVSGIVALLRSRFSDDSAEQVVARLLATAEGSDQARSPWTGAGVVQAHDALTRSLDPRASGTLARSVEQDRRDSSPPPPPQRIDLFGASRALLLWFGLGGGALMALAFMLRSLARR